MVWCITYTRKIKNKKFHPRARTQPQNRTDPHPHITDRSPKDEDDEHHEDDEDEKDEDHEDDEDDEDEDQDR